MTETKNDCEVVLEEQGVEISPSYTLENPPELPEGTPAGKWELVVLAKDDEGADVLALCYRGTGDNTFLVHESVAGQLMEVGPLRLHPENPRRGDHPRIRGSLKYHGQFRGVVVNRGTYSKRYEPFTIGAGNHTFKSALEEGWTHVGVTLIDVSDDELDRIMLVDNASADAAYYDPATLLKVFTNMKEGAGGLAGTGLDDDFVNKLKTSLEAPPDGGREYDESVASDVKMVTCPECEHEFPI